jgi:hypothetical protein
MLLVSFSRERASVTVAVRTGLLDGVFLAALDHSSSRSCKVERLIREI